MRILKYLNIQVFVSYDSSESLFFGTSSLPWSCSVVLRSLLWSFVINEMPEEQLSDLRIFWIDGGTQGRDVFRFGGTNDAKDNVREKPTKAIRYDKAAKEHLDWLIKWLMSAVGTLILIG